MTSDWQEVILEVRRRLIERIGSERYELWFLQVQMHMEENRLRIVAPDQFVLDRIRKSFGSDLCEAVSVVCGGSCDLHYQVDPSLPGRPQRARRASASGGRTACRPESASSAPRRRRHQYAELGDFIVGEGNRLAFAVAESVAQRAGAVSPLLFYGPTGCGKTHLVEGIWNRVRRQAGHRRALILSAEQFTSSFLEALRDGGLPSFRRKCRDVSLLAIDDVQFIAGKRATMVELQNTVDALLRAGSQLVLSADQPPGALEALGSELIARLSGGLVCAIEPADYATRLGIAGRLAAGLRVTIPPEVLELIAAELAGDGRQIAGALNRLEAIAEALQTPITVDLAREALRDIIRAVHRIVRLPDIERAVCDSFGIDAQSLRNGGKSRGVTHPRMLAMWLARRYTRAASSEISQYFGRRSHATAISAKKKVDGWVANGASIQLGQESCHVQDAIRRVERQLRTG